VILGIIFFFIGGISILLISFYLQFYHPMIVNEFRKWLYEEHQVSIGITSIRPASETESDFYHTENDFLDFDNVQQFFIYESAD